MFIDKDNKAYSGIEISSWLKYRQFRSVPGKMEWEREAETLLVVLRTKP